MIYKIQLLFLLLIFAIDTSNAQDRLGGLSASYANITAEKAGLNTDFIGFTASYELIENGFSIRGEYGFFRPEPSEQNKLPQISKLTIAQVYFGKIVRPRKTLQIPIYIGAGYYGSQGDINFGNFSAGGRAGLRLNLSGRFVVFSELSAHYILADDFSYQDIFGTRVTDDLDPIATHIHVGIGLSL